MVKTGLERLLDTPPAWIMGKKLGLLCNPASVNHRFVHARELIHHQFPGQLKALFSPQHGFHAEKQDNMVESGDLTDPILNIPVFSLYGKTRIPAKNMLEAIDILLIDLQDAGTRVYTFIYTMSYCMEVAKLTGTKVVVLDRPNPINGIQVEGNCLKDKFTSFVGRFPIPMRHGLTIGELACLFNDHFNIGCDLEVISMEGWNRSMYFYDTGLPWVAPSPNLPTVTSAMVYPGQVIWEGTNISEGRGTTRPFEIFGAPFLDTDKILSGMGGTEIPGAVLRPLFFEPTFNKWANTTCKGFQIHITDPYRYEPYAISLKLLSIISNLHRDDFKWKQPPYEYEFVRLPIDLITGDADVRKKIQASENIKETTRIWKNEIESFIKMSADFQMYH